MDILEPMLYLHETPEADLPQKVYLEPTTLCNLHCKICFRHGWIGERLGHMSDECFCAARDQILQIPSVEEVFSAEWASRCSAREDGRIPQAA